MSTVTMARTRTSVLVVSPRHQGPQGFCPLGILGQILDHTGLVKNMLTRRVLGIHNRILDHKVVETNNTL